MDFGFGVPTIYGTYDDGGLRDVHSLFEAGAEIEGTSSYGGNSASSGYATESKGTAEEVDAASSRSGSSL